MHVHLHILYETAFVLQQESWVIVTETTWPDFLLTYLLSGSSQKELDDRLPTWSLYRSNRAPSCIVPHTRMTSLHESTWNVDSQQQLSKLFLFLTQISNLLGLII